jgi:PAS domain S-box-containing protein
MDELKARNRELETRVQELQETLDAIRSGEVDPTVVSKGEARKVFSLKGPDTPYRALVESISEGALTLSPEGTVLYANARFASMVRLPADRIIGTSLFDHISPGDQPAFQSSFRRLLGGSCRGRVNLRLGSGSLPVSVSMSSLSAEPGSKISVIVTDRREDAEALRESESVLRSFFDAPGDMRGIVEVVTGTDVRHVADNAVTAGFLGLTPDAMRNKLGSELGEPEEVLRRWIGFSEESRRTGKPVHFEYADQHGEKQAWLSAIVNYLGTNPAGEPRFAYVVRDITDRKRAEEALKENELRYQTVADNTFDWEFWLDPAGKFLYCSPSCEMVTGHKANEFLADPELRRSLIHPHDRPGFDEHQREVHGKHEAAGRGQWRYLRPDGTSCWVEHVCQPIYGEKGEFLGIRGSNRDITERVKAEEAMRGSEARFRALAESMPQIVWSADASGNFDYFNPRAFNYGGVELDDVSGWKWDRVIHPDDLPATMAAWKRSLETGEPFSIEQRLRRADGADRWHLTQGVAIRNESGTITRWIGSSTDVHDIKEAEEALRESEERYRALVDSAPVAILVHHHGKVLYANQLAIGLYGASSLEELQRHDVMQLIPPEERWVAEDRVSGIDEGRRLPMREGTILRLDGIRVPIEVASSPVRYEGVVAAQAIMRDITERKQAAERIAHLASFPQLNPNPVLELNPAGEVIYANPAATRILEILGIGNDPVSFFPGDLAVMLPQLLEGDVQEEVSVGRRVFLETVTLNPLTRTMRIYARDITDRKQAELALRETSEYLENLINYANAPIIVWDREFLITRFNHAFERLTGRSAEEVMGKSLEILFPEETVQDSMDHIRRTVAGERWETVEIPILHKNGKIKTVLWNSATLYEADGKTVSSAIAQGQDITERKQAELALRETSEYLENLINYANAPIIVWDPEFRITRFNHAFERLTGRSAGEVVGKGLEILFPEETVQDSMDHIRRTMAGERWEVVEIPILHRDGSVRTVLWNSATLYDSDRKTVSSAIAQGQDITERKQFEEELHATSQYLENLINHANAPIIVWDPEFRITRFNQAFERLTGRSAEEVRGKNLEILFPADSIDSSMEHIRRTMTGERWEVVEIPILHRDGSVRTVLWNSATLYDSDGKTVLSAIAQGQDITERKQAEEEIRKKALELEQAGIELAFEVAQRKKAEEAVRKTLSILHAALESTADAVLVIDKSGRITSYNQNFTTMWNIPKSVLTTLDTRAATEYVSARTRDPDAFLARIQDISNHPQRESFDTLELLDGRIIERYSKPQKIGNGIVGRVYSFRDVTDRKHAELQLIESLNEKEVLLREIHHRVKNNLQLTTSLLDMTRMRTGDPGTSSILTDVMMKIQTMAQIHTRLYESKQFDRINMDLQIRDQVQALTNIYSRGDREILIEIDSPELYLPLDKAIPCALALNEILSNAYKHAFKGRKSGTVKYRAREEDGRIRFTIADNGIGLPRGFDLGKASTLGLKLVRTLVEQQLKGTLRIRKRKGTEVIVELPMEKEEEEHVEGTRS